MSALQFLKFGWVRSVDNGQQNVPKSAAGMGLWLR
jgi:hypothetical protein